MQLPTPFQIKQELPLRYPDRISLWRKEAIEILEKKMPRLALIVGPCSIHDPKSAIEYALRLKKLSQEVDEVFFPVMRLFFEKPRTRLGWKGMLYDPVLDGSNDIALGIRKSRDLILQIAEIGIPCATELLEPLAIPYFDDLIVWGLIGARTAASQPHRQMASGLFFPIGFKNDFRGDVDVAVAAILASRIAHAHIGIDSLGHIAKIETAGNPFTHLVLRGSDFGPNYDPISLNRAKSLLEDNGLEPRFMIDCSHGNSSKEHKKQKIAFESVIEQSIHNPAIIGLMLESHLYEGKQVLIDDPSSLSYGVSITDSCMGWEETEELIRSTSIRLVQKWCSQVSTSSPASLVT